MPEYTNHLNLYKPNQADDIQVDTSLADNFQKIDDAIANIGSSTGFNVLEYGADPTGVKSSRSAIQKAIDDAENAGGGVVIIPAGTYLSDARINLRSNVTVRGEGLGTVINGTGNTQVFYGAGTLDTEYRMTSNYGQGQKSVTTTVANNINTGDIIVIKSQRNALSYADSGSDWTLGIGTTNIPNTFFGEFKRVRLGGTTNVFFDSPLIYPSYRNDKTNDPNGSAYSTIAKVNAITGARIENLRIVTGTATPIAFTYAHKCYVDSVDIRHTTEGSCVSISNSFQCEVRRVSVHYSSSAEPTNIYSRNALKISGGCQQVGYRECHVENGSQSIDITFTNDGIVNTQCFIDGCTVVGATTNAMTSHAGNYLTSITNNKFINCRGEGVMLRGRKNLVVNNIIQKPYSSLDTEAVGLKFYQGWARDNQVTGNFISGFQIGLYINDTSQTDDSRFKYMGCNIVGNTFDNCRWGIFLYREETNKHSGYVGVNITGNKFVNPPSDGAKGIEIDCYVHGVYIADNVFDMGGVTNACIYAQPNAGAVHVIGNVFNYTTAYGFWHAGVTDTTFWSSRPRMFLKDNISNGIPSGTYNIGPEIRVNRHKSGEVAVNTYFFDDDDSANPKFKNNGGAIRNVNFT